MAVINMPNGPGQSTGNALVTNSPLEYNGDIWYVDSATGVDAASPAGKNDKKPLATLSRAVTNSADGDMIVCMDGHAETLTAPLNIDQDLIIVGGGSSSGKPTVKFTNNQSNAALFTLTGGVNNFVEIRNLWIEENSQSSNVARLNAGGTGLAFLNLVDLYVECNGNDAAAAVAADASQEIKIDGCTFISTSTDNTSQPVSGVAYYSPVVLTMKGTVFDGGTVGFSNYFAMYPISGAPTILRIEEMSLLKGADIQLTEASLGPVGITTATGGARVDWCDVSSPA